jgi:hypothetical protein
LIGNLLLDPFLGVRSKNSVRCFVGTLRKVACGPMNVTKLFFAALAPAADQKVQLLLE